MVDDLLDFSKADDAFFDHSPAVTPLHSCNSSLSGGDSQFKANFTHELCVPYDDVVELEWLSNFVEESFSTEDLHFIPTNTPSSRHSPPIFSVPGKARSKRSRAAPCDWSSRLLLISRPPSHRTAPSIKKQPAESPGRKCLHCTSEKTPQWRTGPMGPKTLCNACGVRFKSGRLVPKYRPAASPTFVSTRHSNSHRKVIELRRQKDLQRQQQHVAQNLAICDEFLYSPSILG